MWNLFELFKLFKCSIQTEYYLLVDRFYWAYSLTSSGLGDAVVVWPYL